MPTIVQSVGEAGEKVVGSAFAPIATGLSKIDNLNILDMGGGANGQSTPLERFALSAPTIIFKVVQQAQALGIDVRSLLSGVGINADELLASMTNPKSTEAERVAPALPTKPPQIPVSKATT
jgi:hypothetical protein